MKFKHKRVVITGATSGIGEALVNELVNYGIEALFITGRQSEKLKELEKSYQFSFKEFQFFKCDLSIKEERKALLQEVLQFKPDLVINNAGCGLYGDAINFRTDQQMEIAEVNGMAVFEITHTVAKEWALQKKIGTILNVSSIAGEYTFPAMALYSAVKKAVTEFSCALDFELLSKGIRVLVFCPGQIKTSFAKRAAMGNLKSYSNDNALTSKSAAEGIIQQIEKQKTLLFFNWRYRLLLNITKLFPKKIIMKILYKNISKRIL